MTEQKGAMPPRLELRMLTLLSQAVPSRLDLDVRHLSDEEHVAQVAFTTTRERAAVVLGLYLLHALQRHGASRLDGELISKLLARHWPAMTHAERVEVEIEAHDMLAFIGATLQPALATATQALESVSPESSHQEVARWAIHQSRDLRIEYYDRHAGALVSHHITPMSLEAGAYLRAISHHTREELVFSLKSAGVLEPLEGWTMHHDESRPPDVWEATDATPIFASDEVRPPETTRTQMSWLDDVPITQEEEE